MAAKPRLTVRLAPQYLHALAYIAARENTTPAEVARAMVMALSERRMTERGWRADWWESYKAWRAEQAARPGRFESPDQADYDALAAGLPSATFAPARAALHRPLADQVADDQAHIKRVADQLAARKVGG